MGAADLQLRRTTRSGDRRRSLTGRTIVGMRLLERDPQLAALDEWAADARAHHGRLVVIAGEAGVGKSALVEAFQARHPEARWLTGACDGLFTPRPLAPVLDISEVVGGELARLAHTPGTAREQLFAAVLRELTASAGLGVLVVEDVHWADRATLDLLHFLSRRLRDSTVLVLVTHRDDGTEPRPDLRRTLGDLVTRGTTRRLTVPPLTRGAVAELTRSAGVGADELYRLTGGNPFFVTEALGALGERVPSTARDAVLSRLVGLGADARRLLDVAALLGTRVPLDLLAEVAGVPTTDAALDEVLAHGVIRGGAHELAFRHEIARLAVAGAVPAHRASEIHRTALAALHETGDDALLAHHAEGAGDAAAVLRYAPSAARTASALGAHREAVEQYRRCLRFADDIDPADRAALLDLLAVELGVTDAWDEARAAGEAALATWEDLGDDVRAGHTLAHLTRAYWRLARGHDSARAARRSLELLEPHGSTPELARALATAAAHHMTASRHDESLALCRRAADLARRLDLPDVLSDVLDTEACVRAARGEDWSGLMDCSLAVAVDHGLHGQAGRAFANRITLLQGELRLEDAEAAAREGQVYSEEHDVGTYSRCILGARAEVLDLMGRWEQVDAACAELLPMASSPENRIQALLTAGRIAARRGDDESSRMLLEEAFASARGSGEPQFLVPARLARAEVSWLSGDLEGAAAEVAAVGRTYRDLDGFIRGEVAAWAARLGVVLEDDADVGEPWRTQLVDPRSALPLWLAHGSPYLAALAGIDAGDESSLRRSLDLLDGLGAVATARLVRRRLRRAGARSVPTGARATTRANPHGLTSREQDVLERLAVGMANAQIAQDLVISPKTVEHHVSAVLAKLGVSDRRSAAERVHPAVVAEHLPAR